ncbi:putative disease resistance protein At3g14460 [Alnus glutinosa]|uniref:putative disease resistance protein At3g14460 n=1 Tax=Alnus glutinosa TaxID=3517 RepID=UPI002D772378|nr:putative disease resistance protein At3g14460 [Alnus glutinosa]
MEEIGNEYFLDLASKSLFEQSSDDKSGFVMHNLVNDLATFVSGQFTFRLGVDYSQKIVDQTRHFSYVRRSRYDNFKKFESLCETSRLHTFLPLKLSPGYNFFLLTKRAPLDHLLPKLRYLRVLSLSHYLNMIELPESIGKIKHLRYLNHFSTGIKRLLDSICKLCNLQTLNLSDCKDLSVLPREMRKLINLRHLDINGTAIKEMPMQLANIYSGASIEELRNLANLRGKLSIVDLRNVVSPTDALKACLKDRKYLEELILEWNAMDANISECQIFVLDNLRPHSHLKSLTINNYGAESLSDWVGHHSFSNIVSLHLENCKNCHNLPPLGQLPSLQDLSVVGFEGVVKVDHKFNGRDSSTVKPFEALTILRFEQMLNWEEWSSFGVENEDGAFPQLEKLYIDNCPKLKGGLPVHLPSLAKFEIYKCPQLVASLPRAPVVCELKLGDCNEVLSKELPTKLRKLVIRGFDALESLPKGRVASNNCLQVLEIREFSEQHERDLVTLCIKIGHCPNFVSFPKGGIRAPDLSFFNVSNYESLRSLPEKMHILLPSLDYIKIINCPRIESFSEGGLPSKVKSMDVKGCDKLFARRAGWGLQKLPSLRYFSVGGKYEDVEFFLEPGLLPFCLTQLHISSFPNMKSLDKKGFQDLTSLQELTLWDNPKLEYIPKEGLPTSLSIIEIYKCPLLRKRWQSKKGKERRKIPDADHILIDNKEFIK